MSQLPSFLKEESRIIPFDRQLLGFFWQPGFDETWFYLDDVFVKEWLIKHASPKQDLCIQKIYDEYLVPHFHKNYDYVICGPEVEHVFSVTGNCLKELCLLVSRVFVRLFVRTDRLAQMLSIERAININKQRIDNILLDL